MLGARQGVFTASVSRRKGSFACSGGCLPVFRASTFFTLRFRQLVPGSSLIILQQEQEPLDAFRLHSDTRFCEESLNESETRNKRYCKAMTLQLPRSDIESDFEETQGLLLFQQPDLEEERSSRFLRVWFAAENEKQHLSWQSKSAIAGVKYSCAWKAHRCNMLPALQSTSSGEQSQQDVQLLRMVTGLVTVDEVLAAAH